jgi:hypothetical protein
MYGEVLSATNPAALLSSLHKSFVHPVLGDPGSIAPMIGQVGAKMGVLVKLQLQLVKLSKAAPSHDKQAQTTAELADLEDNIAHYYDWIDNDDTLVLEGDENWETEETKLIWKKLGRFAKKWEKIEDPTVIISLPNTPVKECMLSTRQLLVDKQAHFEKADGAKIKLARDIASLQMELPRWRWLLFLLSGNGRLLNKHRFACFLSVALVLSSVLLYLSSGVSTRDPARSKVTDDGIGSVYGMLQAHCDHVPANSDGAYFNFWTIWVLIVAYCAVSALFVSRALLHDLAQELLERVVGCIGFICGYRKPATTQEAGQIFIFLLCAIGILICLLSLSCYPVCSLKLPLQVWLDGLISSRRTRKHGSIVQTRSTGRQII